MNNKELLNIEYLTEKYNENNMSFTLVILQHPMEHIINEETYQKALLILI